MNAMPAFSAEQQSYLENLFAGSTPEQLAALLGTDDQGRFTADGPPPNAEPDEETLYGTPISMLCREEQWKRRENALDIWDKMAQLAEKDEFPKDADVFFMKFHGLFYVAPAQDAFMLRTRVPGGKLTAAQFAGLAEMAEDWGGGYADVTTRANMQIREFKPRDVINILTKLHDLGLTSKGSGADNIRNITASPTSGIDPAEVLDVMPYARALHYYILNHRDLYGLPRKFNVAFDNGGAISVAADTNDIGFQAVRVVEGRAAPPGAYLRVQLAGITGHAQFASDCGLLIKPEESVAVAAAMIRVFIENGDRTNRKKARLKYLIDSWGAEKFVAETQKKLAFPLRRFPLEECEPRTPVRRHGYIGVYRQRQHGLNYIGVAIPVGRLRPPQMKALAKIAENHGSGELRLTVYQNLLIPNVPDAAVQHAIEAIVKAGLDYRDSSIMGGMVACTGNTGCKYAATNTKGQAVLLAQYLESKVKLEHPINIHLTGCPHSCAQHYVGDIGLLGTKVDSGGESLEGYNVLVGGGMDNEQGLGREVFASVAFRDLPKLIERMLGIYNRERQGSETFQQFTRRHELQALKEMFAR